MEEIVRLNMRIYGAVQGVGFRYRAYHFAQMMRVTGWVRNCWDGSVEMEAQAPRRTIEDMLSNVGRGAYVTIEHIDYKSVPLEEDERGFHVRDVEL